MEDQTFNAYEYFGVPRGVKLIPALVRTVCAEWAHFTKYDGTTYVKKAEIAGVVFYHQYP